MAWDPNQPAPWGVNPVIDKFFRGRFGEQNPFGGAQLGGPAEAPVGQVGGVVAGGFKPGAPAGEPPWVTRAREQRKLAKQKPPMSTPESQPGGLNTIPNTAPPNSEGPGGITGNGVPGEIVDPWAKGSGNIPAPTGPYNPGPQPTPPAGVPPPLMGGIPRGGIMGGQNVPRPQPPRMQRNPQGPTPLPPPPKAPKAPGDLGSVFGKTPGGGF